MPIPRDDLRSIVRQLASRPGHEMVRSLVHRLLVDGLGADPSEVTFEEGITGEVRGRIDALLGRTLFEFKRNLRSERGDAEQQLADYLRAKEAATNKHYVGVATDGATFVVYEVRDGQLRRLGERPEYEVSPDSPEDLLDWLGSVVAVGDELEPTPEVVKRQLGRDSLAWQLSREELRTLWAEIGERPDVQLKRELWGKFLERVYGSPVDSADLFFQHTYLSIVAKAMATQVLGVPTPDPSDLLTGRVFSEWGVQGVVESDFFDWLLDSPRGQDLVGRIAREVGRFSLRNVQTDVLKGLYESLVDPEQRHDLGEYYTPDWLAQRICSGVINRPLEQRVLDPACGSGTFLFHAVRRLLEASDAAALPLHESLERACRQVVGVDIHPLAVQIARVTYLLALGRDRLRDRRSDLSIPVYLGDSLQWNTQWILDQGQVIIEVPEEEPAALEFPFEVAQDPALFDQVINRMEELARGGAPSSALVGWLQRTHGLEDQTVKALAHTYDLLRRLHEGRRDHIWAFVARNLVRPVWLSGEDQRADVIVGNPPWLAYRFMQRPVQEQFRRECQRCGIWAGDVAQQQDLSGYFFVRSIERYLKATGVIAFVMPYAAMSRRQFHRFREGVYGPRQGRKIQAFAAVRFTQAWVLDQVEPLFNTPACVLFARLRSEEEPVLPENVRHFSGTLPRRDATEAEADTHVRWETRPWPAERDERISVGYATRFRQGAITVPSVLFRVQLVDSGPLGQRQEAPLVTSRRTTLEKPPWKGVSPLRGNVEPQFLRDLYLGESIAPFRLLTPIKAVIPWDDDSSQLLSAEQAQRQGFMYLAHWLAQAETIFTQHGRGHRSLAEQLDYWGQLSAQLPPPRLRVVFSKGGTRPAAAMLTAANAIVDHTLYWTTVEGEQEALYLLAILNSESARKRAEHLQARGQWGPRHFDKVMLQLPIPLFDASHPLHLDLAEAAAHAQQVASSVQLREGIYFIRARQIIRDALAKDGVAQRIDRLVEHLLAQEADAARIQPERRAAEAHASYRAEQPTR